MDAQVSQWFTKASSEGVKQTLAEAVAQANELRWMEKASNPSVAGVAGPNQLNAQMGMSFATQVGFVGTRVFPMATHNQIGGQYPVWSLDDLKNARMQTMGDGRPPVELDQGLEFQSFTCNLYGGRRAVGQFTQANAPSAVRVMGAASEFLMNRAMDAIEREFTSEVWKTGVWATDVTPSPTWDAVATDSDAIVEDIQTGVEALVNVWPNVSDYVFVCSLPVWNAIMRNRVFRGQGAAELGWPGMARFVEVTGIPRVVIGRAGQTNTQGYLGKHAAIFAAPLTGELMSPSAATRVVWSGIDGTAQEGIATRVMADPINFRTLVDVWLSNTFEVQSSNLGYFFNGAIA